MTIREFPKEFGTALLVGYLRDPRVSVDVLSHCRF
ncbi:hypothetical protein [Phenylobacterium sp. J426]